MSRNIQRIGLALMAGFLIIAIALPYWQIVRADDLTNNPIYNRYRLSQAEKSIKRGRILDRNGVVLAQNDASGKRVYPEPWLAGVTGYHSAIYGDTNVESEANGYLQGLAGANEIQAFIDRLLHRPTVGSDVVLTIDSQLQEVAEKAMGTAKGAVVVLDPRTGEVLVMLSHPYADPNRIDSDWSKIKDDPNAPLLDRATQGLYVPGSVFKTVTLAAALDTGVTSPSEVFNFDMQTDQYGRPYHTLNVDGYEIYCGNHGVTSPGHARLTLADAYAVSCNVTFAELGLRLGSQRLAQYAQRFGLGSLLPIDIPSLASRLSLNPNALNDRPTLAASAFGQGQLQATPLQLAEIAATVANGGVAPRPYVMKEARYGAMIEPIGQPGGWHRVMSSETAQQVQEMMVHSVDTGWASPAKIEGVRVAGKTGTAEVGPGKTPNAVFIGFAPADNPVIAVAVVKDNGGGGGTEAAPVAKKVMEAAIQEYKH